MSADTAEVRATVRRVILDKLGDGSVTYVKSNRLANITPYGTRTIGREIPRLDIDGIHIQRWGGGPAPFTWEVRRVEK